ncbi:asparaginase [Candidatus Francisella endociliophora]|nr:asparaginase [Francisella sp. FSC1006]
MVSTEQGYDVEEGYLTKAIEQARDFHAYNMPEFEIKEYRNLIDSSNINPKRWISLALDIAKNYQDYDGFVILHGTDTLAYTASVLSFMLGEIQKPVIVTGSQIPISKIRSDAISNIMNSLIFACSDDIKEVCVYFNQKLRRGNRTTKVSATDLDAFISPNYPSLAYVGIDLDLRKTRLWQRESCEYTPKLETLGVPKIAILTIFPGMDSDILDAVLEPPLQGLILKTYGSGNIPNDPNIVSSLKKANDRGVIMINCTQCLYGTVKMDAYKTARGLTEAGVISGRDMTDEAALGKLFYLLSQPNISHQEIKDAFNVSLQGEVTI